MVWILSFQWDAEEHMNSFKKITNNVILVKNGDDIKKVTHLIIPWWESTVIWRFIQSSGLNKEIKKRYKQWTLSIFWTCAWAILLGKESSPFNLELIDIKFQRNWYWSQINSFEKKIKVREVNKDINAIFIRAPKVKEVWKCVSVLAEIDWDPVMCKQDKVLIATFHPELLDSIDVQKYFLKI